MKPPRYAKAIAAGFAAGSTAVVTALNDGIFTTGEGVTVVLAVLGALGITWVVPNQQRPSPDQRPQA
ncbi:hypothetical protein ACIQPQ_34265 [Streptomyces sp. NPDC091281]|uniref:hypothetical protein n=1 Tax=Streptomyces sp. NPDC091281 TaxID=3365985 RepID=UPI0037FF2C5D